jgi:hypothetical protein
VLAQRVVQVGGQLKGGLLPLAPMPLVPLRLETGVAHQVSDVVRTIDLIDVASVLHTRSKTAKSAQLRYHTVRRSILLHLVADWLGLRVAGAGVLGWCWWRVLVRVAD